MRVLPPEILIAIVSNLGSHDKYRCIRVCKTWHTIIYNSNLFESLSVKPRDVYALLDYFKSRSELSTQVKQLKLLLIDDPDWMDNFIVQFPYVTDIEVDYMGRLPPTQLQLWNKLIRIKEEKACLVSIAALQNPCQHLLYLEMDSLTKVQKQIFLRSLRNAPNLLELRIKRFDGYNLQDMEIIHKYAPKLRTLVSYIGVLTDQEQQFDTSNIQAANSLKTLHMKIYQTTVFSVIRWLDYFGKKYPQLQKIDIDGSYIQNEDYEPHLIKMLQKMPALKSVNIRLTPLTSNILGSIASELDKISISTRNGDIKELEAVMSSRSTQSVKSLSIAEVSGIRRKVNQDIWMNTSLSPFTQLVDLSITNIQCDSNFLVHLLTSLPQLKSLTLKDLTYTETDADTFSRPSPTCIQYLILNATALNREEDSLASLNRTLHYLLEACPSLKKFDLKHRHSYMSLVEDDKIDLDFRQHKQLKSIRIVAMESHYYLFDHLLQKKDKRWMDFSTEFDEFDADGYAINLAWSGNVELQLT